MGDQTFQRRLAAVLAADVVGYTRLMEEDSEGTVSAWATARENVIKPYVSDHLGKIVKLTGDGFLVEFPTVQEAVRCAIAMQQGLASSSLKFRMGVNLGDIIDDGEDIHGEGVNIAARIESLAEEGAVNISGDVYNQVRNRIEANFQDLGEHEVKNVSTPVRIYAVKIDPNAVALAEEQSGTVLKPSIAVLPFDNLSGDAGQDYFADGITEDIVTALSHIRSFFVIARNTTFTYKGKAVDVQSVADELGVHYVLEGSVRCAGGRIRITAQLIDGESGNHIWAERYDRELADIFEVQDEITRMVVGAIEPELNRAEQNRARRKPPENLDAWGAFQRGVWSSWQDDKENHMEAKRLFRRAIQLDPEFCSAHAFLAFALWRSVPLRTTDTPAEDLIEAMTIAKRALSLDQGNAHAHWAMGLVYMHLREHQLAQRELERAIRINPGFANAYQYLGWVKVYDQQIEDGIQDAETAQRLSPNDPALWGTYLIQAQGYINLRQFAKAEELARQAKQLAETLPINCAILAASGFTGNTQDAAALINDVAKVEPNFTAQKIEGVFPFQHQTDIDIWVEGLRKAGVPDN